MWCIALLTTVPTTVLKADCPVLGTQYLSKSACEVAIIEAAVLGSMTGRRAYLLILLTAAGAVAVPLRAEDALARLTPGKLEAVQQAIVKLKAEQRNYGLLEDLNTRPRTTYLAALRNPNPALEGQQAETPARHEE